MRVHVDGDKCQGHNRCYAIAPELFDVDDLGYAHELNDGVVSITRDYLATWSALELSRLPQEAFPGRIHDPEHISNYAYYLTQAHLAFAGTLTDGLLLDRMMVFFTHASARLSQIAHPSKVRLTPLDLLDISNLADEQ